jgi:hypothetical protein
MIFILLSDFSTFHVIIIINLSIVFDRIKKEDRVWIFRQLLIACPQ